MIRQLDGITSRLATRARMGTAQSVALREPSSPLPPPHHLTLYDFEGSPWCRLVREYTTILDLRVHMRPCPRETLFGEGVFTTQSRFRPQAMQHLKESLNTDDLIFPLLVDRTRSFHDPVVIRQSYDILTHLWGNYGQSVIPSKHNGHANSLRPDQRVNHPSIPFPLRFLLLSTPSYLRPWPRCGVMRFPSTWDRDDELILYQSEGCSKSRLVREALCSLEIPCLSIPVAKGSSNARLLNEILRKDETDLKEINLPVLHDPASDQTWVGAEQCVVHLWGEYHDETLPSPTWLNPIPADNIGRTNVSFSVGVYAAFLRGSRAFVPTKAME
jgi:hypothetical protein